jgi:hypothetical protein
LLTVIEKDLDGDGFFAEASQGEFQDCCDSVDDGCYDPYMVNPGAWEIPNNGQADRCIEGLDAIPTNVPCDFRATNIQPTLQTIEGTNPVIPGTILSFVGPNVTPQQTEAGIIAMVKTSFATCLHFVSDFIYNSCFAGYL